MGTYVFAVILEQRCVTCEGVLVTWSGYLYWSKGVLLVRG